MAFGTKSNHVGLIKLLLVLMLIDIYGWYNKVLINVFLVSNLWIIEYINIY